MQTLILSLLAAIAVTLLACLGMALGALSGRGPLRRGCGGPSCGKRACSLCQARRSAPPS